MKYVCMNCKRNCLFCKLVRLHMEKYHEISIPSIFENYLHGKNNNSDHSVEAKDWWKHKLLHPLHKKSGSRILTDEEWNRYNPEFLVDIRK
jgi:hypothetical protein